MKNFHVHLFVLTQNSLSLAVTVLRPGPHYVQTPHTIALAPVDIMYSPRLLFLRQDSVCIIYRRGGGLKPGGGPPAGLKPGGGKGAFPGKPAGGKLPGNPGGGALK